MSGGLRYRQSALRITASLLPIWNLRIDSNGPAIGGSRLLELPFLGKYDAQASHGGSIAWIFLQPRAPLTFRFLQPALLFQRSRRQRAITLRRQGDSAHCQQN